jgi:hypothetical protein
MTYFRVNYILLLLFHFDIPDDIPSANKKQWIQRDLSCSFFTPTLYCKILLFPFFNLQPHSANTRRKERFCVHAHGTGVFLLILNWYFDRRETNPLWSASVLISPLKRKLILAKNGSHSCGHNVYVSQLESLVRPLTEALKVFKCATKVWDYGERCTMNDP